MTTTTTARTSRNKWRHLLRNPVTIKELRSRMRGRRAFIVLTLYLLLLSMVVSFVYLTFVAGSSVPGSLPSGATVVVGSSAASSPSELHAPRPRARARAPVSMREAGVRRVMGRGDHAVTPPAPLIAGAAPR